MIEFRAGIDLVGWVGAIVLLAAYASVSTRRMQGDSRVYQVLNLIGGACLIINTVYYGAYPSAVVNLVWIGIAVYTLARTRS
jgi:hypothetical protein